MTHSITRTVALLAALAGVSTLRGGSPEGDTVGRTHPRAAQPLAAKKDSAGRKANALPNPLPGWVQKDIEIRVPMLVPERLADGLLPPNFTAPSQPKFPFPPTAMAQCMAPPVAVPKLSIPSQTPDLPAWARAGFWLPSVMQFPQFPAFELKPDKVDEGSLRFEDTLMPDGQGGHLRIRVRTWTSHGIPCRDLTLESLADTTSIKPQEEAAASADAEAKEETPIPADAEAKEEAPAPADADAKEETPAPADADAKEETPAPAEAEAKEETPTPADADVKEETPAPAEADAKEETPAPAEAEAKEERSSASEKPAADNKSILGTLAQYRSALPKLSVLTVPATSAGVAASTQARPGVRKMIAVAVSRDSLHGVYIYQSTQTDTAKAASK